MEEEKKKILIADDSRDMLELLEIMLKEENYDIVMAVNGIEAVEKTDESIDLIILDVMMPYKNGYEACSEIRKKATAPILFLTANRTDSDKELGFELGADDYILKPFSHIELISRVRALLRRYYIYKGKNSNTGDKLVRNELVIDTELQTVYKNNELIVLTVTEYNILVLLMKNRKKIIPSEKIYEEVWNEKHYYNANNTIMVHILKLRKKLENDYKKPEIIKTAWGKGYYID